MSAITDGTFTSAVQDGDKLLAFPFDMNGDAYARTITRNYVMLSPSYTQPRTLTTNSITNYLLRSETFDNASWTKTNTTATADALANPHSGEATADSVLETAANSIHTVSQSITYTAVAHTASVFVKGVSRDWCAVEMNDGTGRNCYFNVTTGTVGTASGGAVGVITSAGNGWYRCSVTATMSAAAGNLSIYIASADTVASYAGDITKGLYLWGAQVERASAVGTYLPTTSATRTSALRTRDAEDNTGDSAADQFAFLLTETPPDAGGLGGGIARISRTYGRVPAPQISYTPSRYIQVPDVPDSRATALASYRIVSAGGVASLGNGALFYATGQTNGYVWSANNKFYSLSAGSVTATHTTVTGGTFTLTYKSSTTAAINYNETAANIAATLNALASVVADGITFGSCSNQLNSALGWLLVNATVGTPTQELTMNSASLTPAATTSNFITYTSLAAQTFYIGHRATVTAHGYTATNDLFFVTSTGYYSMDPAQWDIVDANTVAFNGSQMATPNTYSSITATFGGYSTDYKPGTRLVRVKQTENFYLPGWTSGVTLGSDISTVSDLQATVDFITAALTLTGFQTYLSEGPEVWVGPILVQRLVAINLDDL